MLARLLRRAREAQIKQIESLMKEAAEPFICIDCGWKGKRQALGGWLGFGDVSEFCPGCGHSEFLVGGEELDEMNREDETCKLARHLSCHLNS